MSYVRVWIHAVWATKKRERFLMKEIRPQVLGHIRKNAKDKGIYIDELNGDSDHLHCLFALYTDMTIAKTLQLIKGESAYWINKEKATPVRFAWAGEYYAASVSESDLGRVREYIGNQEEHHHKMTFAEEVEGFLRKHNFTRHG